MRLFVQPFGTRRQGALPLNHQALAQVLQGLRLGEALHLHPVATPVAPGRIGEALLQTAVAGEQQQAFAVGIEAAGGVDVRDRDVIGQATPAAARFRCELAEHPVGLVEQQGGQRRLRALRSGCLAGAPEVHHADRDQQQAQIHRNGRQDHGGGSAAEVWGRDPSEQCGGTRQLSCREQFELSLAAAHD